MNISLQNLRGDLFGGITVTIVILPIGLAYGVASGLGPITGVYSAIAAGFFVAVFGGTPARIAAPTAPMTVAMTIIVTQHATSLAEALTIVMLGGLMQILMGLLGLGRFVVYTPYSVVAGFTSGIGVIIILMQTLPLAGLPAVPGGALGALAVWPQVMGGVNTDALQVGAVALAVGIFWPPSSSAPSPPSPCSVRRLLSARSPQGFPIFTCRSCPPGFSCGCLSPLSCSPWSARLAVSSSPCSLIP